jgi:hypothetical protein
MRPARGRSVIAAHRLRHEAAKRPPPDDPPQAKSGDKRADADLRSHRVRNQ